VRISPLFRGTPRAVPDNCSARDGDLVAGMAAQVDGDGGDVPH
jgi:hypothetical protein